MNNTLHLELIFTSADDKSKKISLKDPREDITQDTALEIANAITASDLFQDEFGKIYQDLTGARYVRREVDNILVIAE